MIDLFPATYCVCSFGMQMPRSRRCCIHHIMSCYAFAMQVTAERARVRISPKRDPQKPHAFIFIIYCMLCQETIFLICFLFFFAQNQVVCRFVTIPAVLDGPYGAIRLHEASYFGLAITLYSGLFRFDCADFILCYRGKFAFLYPYYYAFYSHLLRAYHLPR